MDNPPQESSSRYGYPTPGVQHVTANDIMKSIYFMSDERWEMTRRQGNFDFVVIGSSFCALAFTHKVLENNPKANVLIIERGAYFHPQHFQNLPPAYVSTVGGTSETFPWSITKATHDGEHIKWQHGMNNFFGGRSSFWSGWCPEPTDKEMEDWPPEVIHTVHQYFPQAAKLLNVVSADKIFDKELHEDVKPMFKQLQLSVQKMLMDSESKISTVTRVIPAPLAVGANMYRCVSYGCTNLPHFASYSNLHSIIGTKTMKNILYRVLCWLYCWKIS